MLNPNIGKLIKAVDNRYELVLDIAKEARAIAETDEVESGQVTEKPITLAINKLAKEKGL